MSTFNKDIGREIDKKSTFFHGIVCNTSNSGPFCWTVKIWDNLKDSQAHLNVKAEEVNSGVSKGQEESV